MSGQKGAQFCQDNLCDEGQIKRAGFIQRHPMQVRQFILGP